MAIREHPFDCHKQTARPCLPRIMRYIENSNISIPAKFPVNSPRNLRRTYARTDFQFIAHNVSPVELICTPKSKDYTDELTHVRIRPKIALI
jgi:hypothetical protein